MGKLGVIDRIATGNSGLVMGRLRCGPAEARRAMAGSQGVWSERRPLWSLPHWPAPPAPAKPALGSRWAMAHWAGLRMTGSAFDVNCEVPDSGVVLRQVDRHLNHRRFRPSGRLLFYLPAYLHYSPAVAQATETCRVSYCCPALCSTIERLDHLSAQLNWAHHHHQFTVCLTPIPHCIIFPI